MRDLFTYFGLYSLAGLLDRHIVQKELAIATGKLIPAFVALQLALLI